MSNLNMSFPVSSFFCKFWFCADILFLSNNFIVKISMGDKDVFR